MLGLHTAVVSVGAGDLLGGQVSAVGVTAGQVRGAQVGVVNVAGGAVAGAQVGTVNVGWNDVRGTQVSVVNIGGDVVGLQLGVINIASTVRGAQVGLLNIAKTSDAPIGLLNIITQGRARLALWSNETSVLNVAVKLGSAHVYCLLMGGLNPRGRGGKVNLSYGAGLGVHLDFGNFYGELEATFEDVHQMGDDWRSSQAFSTGLHLNVGYQLFERVAVFAGPQVQTLIAIATPDVKALAPWGFDASSSVRVVPGVVVGLQFF
jgi:hypothetical protein